MDIRWPPGINTAADVGHDACMQPCTTRVALHLVALMTRGDLSAPVLRRHSSVPSCTIQATMLVTQTDREGRFHSAMHLALESTKPNKNFPPPAPGTRLRQDRH